VRVALAHAQANQSFPHHELITQQTVRLGAASVLQIARAALPSLAPGRAGDRARNFLTAILRRVVEARVLLPLASKQQGPSPALAALQVRDICS
jgi:hypothetical protein